MSTATAELNLVKGQKIAMPTGLTKIAVGVAWDFEVGKKFDIDLFCYPLDANKKVADDTVYFGHLSTDGVKHSGDNLTGEGDGDDEVITVDVATLKPAVKRLAFYVNIYNQPSANFGQIKAASCRAFDPAKPAESICKYDLNEDYSANNAIHLGDLYEKDGAWKFEAIGESKSGDINALRAPYM